MAIKLTAGSFINVVKQSRLVDEEQLIRLLEEFKQKAVDLKNSRAIGNALVEAGTVTRWQCDKLLEGKHKGFFLGKYRLMSLLGKGGMSSVFRADHILMRRTCAIKVLPAKRVKDSSYLERFHREAQAVASLDHPNIVRAYDVDHEEQKGNEIHFLVMEHVDGKSLQEIVNENGPFNFIQSAEYFRQSAEGLEHAHKAGLVHRDIKPGNLLVDPNGVIKILDLGLARFFEQEEENPLTLAHDEKVLGTADYLAPEQALDSHEVDIRADIYSLGCTFYFVLTAHPPFNEGTLAQRLMWHQTKEPPPISVDRPDTPQSLSAIIEKMMAKKPDERYQTAGEVANVLREWLIEYGDADWKEKNKGLMVGSSVPVAKPVVASPVESPPKPESTKVSAAEKTVTDAPVAAPAEVVEPEPIAPQQPEPEPVADEGLASFLSNLDVEPSEAPSTKVQSKVDTSFPSPALTEAKTEETDSSPPEIPAIAKPVAPVVAQPVKTAKSPPPAAAPVVATPVSNDTAPPGESSDAMAETVAIAPVAEPIAPTKADAGSEVTFPDFSALDGGAQDEPATLPDFSMSDGTSSADETATVPDFEDVAPADEAPAVVAQDAPDFPDLSASEQTAPTTESIVPTAEPVKRAAKASTTKPAKSVRKSGTKKKPLVAIISTVAVVLIAVVLIVVFKGDGSGGDGESEKVADNSQSSNGENNGENKNEGKSESKSKQTQGPTKRYPTSKTEFTIGAAGDFKTIREALAYVKANRDDYDVVGRNAKKILFKVAGGETYNDVIHVDDSYPAGIRLIVEGDQKAVLAPSGTGPAIRLDNAEFFHMDGFDIKADGFPTAIELKGYLQATQLRRLSVSGFTKNGIHAISTYGVFTPDELILNEITLNSGSAESVGLRISEEGLSRTKISNCRFLGKMSVGVLFDGESRYLELRETIFSETDIGLKFVGADRVWSDLVVANNTFHSLKQGVVFTNMPKTNSKEIGFYRNLFAAITGPELIIENGYEIKQFNSKLSTLSGGVSQNWSDRADPGAELKGGEHRMVQNPETQRVANFQFVSTDLGNPKFLAPAPNTPYSRIGGRGRGFKPYVGAVAP